MLSQKDKKFYIGFTVNITERTKRHHAGEVLSTKYRRPLDLIFYEAYLNKSDALRREKYFKTTKGKTTLRTMLSEYLKELGKENKENKRIELKNKKKILIR